MFDSDPPVAGLREPSRSDGDPLGASAPRRFFAMLICVEAVGIVGPVILIALAMSVAFPGFASPFNVDALLATIAVTSVVGLAQVSVLAIGQFNLALPAMGAF